MVSAVLELVEPATEKAPIWATLALVLVGANVFTGLDYAVKETWGANRGARPPRRDYARWDPGSRSASR